MHTSNIWDSIALLKGFLSFHITMRIIIATNQSIPSVAYNFCTTNSCALLPNNLCIMQALLIFLARITLIIIIRSFPRPRGDSIARLPILAAPPEEVFAVVALGMHQLTVPLSLVSPPVCVICKFVAPFEGWESKFCSYFVVWSKVLFHYVSWGGCQKAPC